MKDIEKDIIVYENFLHFEPNRLLWGHDRHDDSSEGEPDMGIEGSEINLCVTVESDWEWGWKLSWEDEHEGKWSNVKNSKCVVEDSSASVIHSEEQTDE